jgi:hypothetical protein
VVGDIPGVDDAAVFAPWNEMAGYELLRNGPAPDITFVALTPVCSSWDCTDHVAASGIVGSKIIFYDPTDPHSREVFVWQHEIAHIVMEWPTWNGSVHSDCSQPGVLSECGFWTDRPGWFGPGDRALLEEALTMP